MKGCKTTKGIKVFVGVSGGVDSSVATAMLQKAGYDVTGVFIRTWQPDFIVCTERDERRDAIRVCAVLGIPFLECDAVDAYKKSVADYMIEEYRLGRTPNPDVMCNREIKFGVFWEFAKEHGADFIATGHYARILAPLLSEEGVGGGDSINSNHHPAGRASIDTARHNSAESGTPPQKGGDELQLLTGLDHAKDQSYFLWTLTPEDLKHILFPIGHLPKSEVRKLAEKFNLPTATKKDSQGICMLGKLDLKEFLAEYIKPERGDVLDEVGNVIGYHDGAVFLTIGERHGFTITVKSNNDAPYFVISKDIKKNQIIVSTNKPDSSSGSIKEIKIIKTNWIITPNINKKYECQIRYHGNRIKCAISDLAQNSAVVVLDTPVLVSSGQSLVVYDGEVCMGGGVIS